MNVLYSISIFSVLYSSVLSSNDTRNVSSAYQPGNVIIGGLFPAHLSWREKCADLNMKGIVLIEAMMYTVNKINSEKILPGKLTLGFHVRDTCDNRENALKSTLTFLDEDRYSSVNEGGKTCGMDKDSICNGKLMSVVGAGSTELSVAVNKILSVFDIPQVGYASTSGILSDKSQFPSFSRTVVIGSNKPQVITKIISHFGWKNVGLLVSNDLLWKSLSLEFKNLARSNGICIDVDDVLSDNTKILGSIVSSINASKTSQVTVLFASLIDTFNVVKLASSLKIQNKVWIMAEKIPSDVASKYAETLQGMITIEREPETVKEFTRYFTTLNPLKNKWNPWFSELWEDMFHCTIPRSFEELVGYDAKDAGKRLCSGKEEFGWVSQVVSLSHATHVIDAVMAATQVIKNICTGVKDTNTSSAREQCLHRLTRKNILSHMFKAPFTFNSLFNRTVSLDKNGNVISSYTIYHLRKSEKGMSFHKVGSYKSYQDKLEIYNDNIRWPRDFKPIGSCGSICGPGQYRDFEGSKCCWACKTCPVGTFNRDFNAAKCTACPKGTDSNKRGTTCKKQLPKYFDWGDSGGVTLVIASLVSFFIAFVIFCIFLKYKSSAVVSGWGSSANFYLIWSISLGVMVPFTFIGYPSDSMCKLQAVVVSTTLTLSVSLVWVKIRLITCKRKNMISRLRVLSYGQKQTIYALCLTIIEILFCTLWVIISPPFVAIKTINSNERIAVCTHKNASWYVLSFCYIFSITLITTFRACKVKCRTFNFSEAKFILAAMICVYLAWGIYVTVFFSTTFGFHHATLLCWTAITTQMIILGFIFLPKIYILFWKPEMGKDCEFKMDNMYSKGPTTYELSSPRHLHPNGILVRSHSASFRDDISSRGSPSQVSLDITPTIISPHQTKTTVSLTANPLVARLNQIQCCAGILRDEDDSQSVASDDQPNYPNNTNTARQLPLIMIDAGTRSNSQISERALSPRLPNTSRQRTIDDQDSLSATMDDNTEVWAKRHSSGGNYSSLRTSHQQNDEYCLRFALNEKMIEKKHLRRQQNVNDKSMRESRL